MKKTLLLFSVLLTGYFVGAQQDITVVTGATKGKIEFQDFRKIDLQNPNAADILFTKADKLQMEVNKADGKTAVSNCTCSNYIAAMTETLNGEIVYIPMTKPGVNFVNTASKSGNSFEIADTKINPKDQGSYYAKMTTAPDGAIYALNNEGSELLRITANGVVQNLGAVAGMKNIEERFGVKTTNYGGDMVADVFGNLYVISAPGHVYKVNPKSMNSEYLGQVTNLPQGYTVNGAAVTKEGKILLATTSPAGGMYTMDIRDLKADFFMEYDLSVYDLSSLHFLNQNMLTEIADIQNMYNLYPTVVKNSELNIVSKSSENANLHVTVWNINNKQVYAKDVNINAIGDFKVHLNGSLQPGVYVMKAVNQNGVEVINTKFSLLR